jgi:multiple sugar transport system permease protein
MHLYRSAFEFSDFGAASAMSWLLFVLMMGLTVLLRRLLGERRR